ncbi:hypothetical protein EVAR_14275_1 [Eumeta japonica]|uniref:Uncharacterized protein n=1 Tax=Eumeta variegata TaxID=151549 RepID=A0A4C1W9M7_EUMVA|nr:hypothetical protein EVAR_14275_1 [Eumeta japonica]
MPYIARYMFATEMRAVNTISASSKSLGKESPQVARKVLTQVRGSHLRGRVSKSSGGPFPLHNISSSYPRGKHCIDDFFKVSGDVHGRRRSLLFDGFRKTSVQHEVAGACANGGGSLENASSHSDPKCVIVVVFTDRRGSQSSSFSGPDGAATHHFIIHSQNRS